jgi:ribosomal protein S18 acetylase RimI-like enzyme
MPNDPATQPFNQRSIDVRIDVRRATPNDAAAIAAVHVRAWQAAYAHILAPDYLRALSIADRTAHWGRILAQADNPSTTEVAVRADGRVAGFVSLGPSRDDGAGPADGEVWALYADPADWGQGFGRALISRAVQTLRSQGRPRIGLWVLADNARGRAFYEVAGFRPVAGSEKRFELGGRPVVELAYRLAEPA